MQMLFVLTLPFSMMFSPDDDFFGRYATYGDFQEDAQGVLLRPWMLTYQQSSGFKGYVDPVGSSLLPS